MKKAENKFSNFLQSRSGTALMVLSALCAAVFGKGSADSYPAVSSGGFAFASASGWIADASVAFAAGLGLTALVGLMMWAVNRTFNLLRDSSTLFLGVFAVLQCSTPLVVGRLWQSIALTAVVLGVTATFYSVYMRPRQTRRIFLAFCVMSAGSLFDYVYALYAALMLLAFHQMRCPSPRMYLAAAMGIVTPWWMAWGFGLPDHGIHLPERLSVFASLDRPQLVMTLVTVGITVIVSILVCCTNMVKIYSYNARSRALSGLLAMLSLFTATATLVDIANAWAYLSTLNCLTAFQIGLFFRITEKRRGYIYIVSLFAVCAILYLCNIWL